MNNLIKLAITCMLLMSASPAMSQDCAACNGKINNMMIRFDGADESTVRIYTKGGVTLVERLVNPGEILTLEGYDNYLDKKGTLGPMIFLEVNYQSTVELHTSCSIEIGSGTIVGDFVVISATSRNGGLTCPVGDIPEPPESEND